MMLLLRLFGFLLEEGQRLLIYIETSLILLISFTSP